MQKKQDLFMDLLYVISRFLGYNFSKSQIKNDIYSPRAHGDLEMEQTIIRQGVVALFKGEASLPMTVKEFPPKASRNPGNSNGPVTEPVV